MQLPSRATVLLTKEHNHSKDTHILVSTLQESHLFRFEGGSRLARVSSSSTAFVMTEPTLALGNIPEREIKGNTSGYLNSSLVVQVTRSGVGLFNYDMTLGEYTKIAKWMPAEKVEWRGRSIVAASVNASQFVVGLNGGTLVLLNLSGKDSFNLHAWVV